MIYFVYTHTFKIPLWSDAAVLVALRFWNWSRFSSKLSSSLLNWFSSNDTLDVFNDDFDALCGASLIFNVDVLLSPPSPPISLLILRNCVETSSVSNIGLYERCLFGVRNGDSSFSIITVSKLVDVDEFDNEPSAVSTRE